MAAPANQPPAIRQRIVPHLWFDTQAVEAAEFYASAFPDSRVNSVHRITDTPSGDCDIVSFSIAGFEIQSISAGPQFAINPSISFMVNFDPSRDPAARETLDALWERLADGGEVRMALDAYPFSERFGWVADRFGVNWQLILSNPDGDPRPFIMPSLMFTGDVCGQAEAALNSYTSIFENSLIGQVVRWGDAAPPNPPNGLMYSDFSLAGQWFTAMDSAFDHGFTFDEGVSLIVSCQGQDEVDYFWKRLSDGGQEVQCGWLKDQFGVSWQIVPRELGELMSQGTPEQGQRVQEAFMKMVKFDIAELRQAYDG